MLTLTRRQKVNIYIILATTLGLLLIGGTVYYWYKARSAEVKVYKDPNHGFSLKYPAQWEVSHNTPGTAVVFLSPQEGPLDKFRENVNIVVQDLSGKPQTIIDYSQQAVQQVRVVFKENMRVLESQLAKFAGRDGYRFMYLGKGPQGQGDIKFLHYWTIKNQKAYQLTFSALTAETFDLYSKQVERMADSFRIE